LAGGEEELARVAVSVGWAGRVSGLAEEETVRPEGVWAETVWFSVLEVEPKKLPEVEVNTAVTGSVPSARAVDEQLALLEDKATAEQRVVPPEEKVTVPDWVPEAVELTVVVQLAVRP
jgi:hypothetical protein